MRRAAPLLALLLLAGCGGHGGGSSTVRAAKGGRATMTVRWPSATSARFIPGASWSLVVTVSRADGTGAVKKTIGRPPSGVNTTATTLTGLPYGVLSVDVQAFPVFNGTGVAQAQGAGTMAVTEDVPGTVSVALDSTVASLSILPTPLTVSVGGKTTLTASAMDAQGSIVLLSAINGKESLTWTTDDPTVDTVAGSGPTATLTSVAVGTAHVSASFVINDAGTSVSATAPVTNARTVFGLTGPDTIVFGYGQAMGHQGTTNPPFFPVASSLYTVHFTPPTGNDTVVSTNCTAPLALGSGGTSSSFTVSADAETDVFFVSLKASRIDADILATLSASAGAYGSATQTVTVKPNPLASVAGSALTVKGGGKVTGTAILGKYALATEPVSLSCSDPAVTLPASVTIPAPSIASYYDPSPPPKRIYYYALADRNTFTITTPTVTTARTVTITATRLGVTKSFDLMITP